MSERGDGSPTIEEVVEQESIHVDFQPIVRLGDGEVVAHEALARGPVDTPLHKPDALFAAAREAGLTRELDELCMRRAFADAAETGISTLFVNAEPSTFSGPVCLPQSEVQVVVEVTERGLVDRPAELLDALERSRQAGWGVAVDDVGAEWQSLALLPVLAPEVVKLDRSVLADGPTRAGSRVLRASRAYTDRRGKTLLAEGIEDRRHAEQAVAFGATLGQGFFLGHPAPRPARTEGARLDVDVASLADERHLTPFALLQRDGVATAVTTKRHLLTLSHDIELDASEQPDPNILLGTFESHELFTPATRRRYSEMSKSLAYVTAFGVFMPPQPTPGVVGVALSPDEPLAAEWDVISVGPHQTSALIARDLGDETTADLDRRFEYALLSGRDLIERAARSLMLRMTAAAA